MVAYSILECTLKKNSEKMGTIEKADKFETMEFKKL